MGLNYAKNLAKQRVERSRFYSAMGGVDFSSDPSQISKSRFSDLENMYRDYESEGAGVIESVPGFRVLARLGSGVRKIYLQKGGEGGEMLLLVTESGLYRLPIDEMDNENALAYLGALPKGEIAGFPYGDAFFLISGGKMWRVSREGVLSTVGFGEGELAPYIPTVYKNGVAHEQRNLLSSRCYETVTLHNPSEYSARSDGLLFEITDEDARRCALAGRSHRDENVLFVPSTTEIDGKLYSVTSVASGAFADDSELCEVHFAEGLERIGIFAFLRCTALERVFLPESIQAVEMGAFNECISLSYLYFGVGLTEANDDFLDGCDSLLTLHFAFSEAEYLYRFPRNPFEMYEKVYRASNYYLCADIPIFSHAAEVLRLTMGEDEIPFALTYTPKGEIACARIVTEDRRTLVGAELTLLLEYAEVSDAQSFPPDAQNDAYAPLECPVCELFDGRIFLAGSKRFPNTVFYTERDSGGRTNPTYFGVYNRFDDGIGSFAVNAMLSVGNTLAVFKENDDGSGSIFYHTPQQTSEGVVTKIYPTSDIHSGLVGLGAVISYYDEPIFVSESGICALWKSGVSSQRSVKVRSHRIHPRLLCEPLGKISLARWCGYLVVCVNGKLFLADYRQFSSDSTGEEYEWYYLCGIGSYEGDETVFRFHPSPAPYYRSILPDEITTDKVMSEIAPDGLLHYYVKPSYIKYEVYATEEKRGGVFSPATKVFSCGKLLFFTTENGTLCVFNNDKRGKAPMSRIFENDREREEYERFLGNRLHRSYYAFASHAPHYVLATKRDNCDIPHLEKDSVRDSLTLKCRMDGAGEAMLEVKTEKDGYADRFAVRGGSLDFGEVDFSSLVFSTEAFHTIACRGRVKKFVEKEIRLSSDAFASPLALSSVAYRYTVHGKIKNK